MIWTNGGEVYIHNEQFDEQHGLFVTTCRKCKEVWWTKYNPQTQGDQLATWEASWKAGHDCHE